MFFSCKTLYIKAKNNMPLFVVFLLFMGVTYLSIFLNFKWWLSTGALKGSPYYYYGYQAIKDSLLFSLFFMSPLLIWGEKLKWLTVGVLIWLYLFEGIEVVTMLLFNQRICSDVPMLLWASSFEEIKEFILLCFNWKFFIGILSWLGFALALILFFKKNKFQTFVWQKWCGVISIFCFVLLTVVHFERNINRLIFVNFLYDCACNAKEIIQLRNMASFPKLPSSIHVIDKKIVGVLVIGESACRNYCSVYGYSKKTTPCIDEIKDEIVLFEDCISSWSSTTNALRFLLTTATLDNKDNLCCTIFDVYRKAGFNIVLLSNQPAFGFSNGPATILFNAAQKKLFLRLTESNAFDEKLYSLLKADIESINQPTLFVLHLRGSHFVYNKQYPASFNPWGKFSKNEDNNQKLISYENSITYTDQVLGDVVKLLKEKCPLSFLCYISDHGESPRSKADRDILSKDVWEIPFLVWFSPKYKAMYKEKWIHALNNRNAALQTDRLFFSLLDIGNVLPPPVSQSVFSDCFQPHTKRLLTVSEKNVILYNK